MTKGRLPKICEICYKSFENKSNLNRHMKLHEKKEEKYFEKIEEKKEEPRYSLEENEYSDNDYFNKYNEPNEENETNYFAKYEENFEPDDQSDEFNYMYGYDDY